MRILRHFLIYFYHFFILLQFMEVSRFHLFIILNKEYLKNYSFLEFDFLKWEIILEEYEQIIILVKNLSIIV
jgi:hypothetical protein